MNLKMEPFNLTNKEVEWVENTLNKMTLEEKIGQLFCPIGYSTNPEYLNSLLNFHIGGLFFRDGVGEEMYNTFSFVQKHSKIPLLIPSNIEAGGDGAAIDGTPFGKQMACAAAGDKKYAYRLGQVSSIEAASLGINWAFAPVVDIDFEFRNPITNVRTYGNDPKVVLDYAKEYMRAAHENNVEVSVKHFPGDGIDERDQHLLTSVNHLSIQEWDNTFGIVYEGMIKSGAKTIMAGHIALPAYQTYFNKEDKDKIIPASLSKELLNNLLRDKLKFNGLIISDATPMVGFASAMPRNISVPTAIENGCDMFLFNKDLEEDYKFMLSGYKNGLLSEERLLAANRRILALKASMKLNEKQTNGTLIPPIEGLNVLKCKKHIEWAIQLADQSITLVKDTQNLLPINSDRYKNVLLEVIGDFDSNERVIKKTKLELEKSGFNVILYEKENFNNGVDNVRDLKEKYDLVIYMGNVENASNKTTNRINWYTFWGQGNNIPWFAGEIPVIFISLANPYHLFDVPMIKTYINAYSNNDYVIEMVVKKVLGDSDFKGNNPIDPFCGRKELKY
ncbi:beta-hexosaminidase [Erysipelothrix larvae]|uniref:beta-N-acetylhexosaminidase n=1 Tax=Erysipelothrix larvae TaxID=1514105 RepID=A0A0X8H1S1_9FIRM|nr:glycoside hydrolase family 3 N-terminal domain-containing protein [Erysipelothrix larvae]AMC94495.1 beta-hexosaminidase [Erysipelothrix larvae]